jgi:GDPmannose 4,6-dehydratase
MMPIALITGITGQDGSYLAELLLEKGYEVHGVIRRSSTFGTQRIEHIFDRLNLHYGDVTDGGALMRIVRDINPDEIYNLAAQSHVRVSFDQPAYTADAVAIGTLNVLEAARCVSWCRVYQASSSEMFGNASTDAQSETTPFRPRSPYGCAKVFAHHLAVNYRESYGMHVSCGILFNHESPRRGETFVTRKITRAVGRIKYGLQDKLYLGNLDAQRDWGYAGDYVEAMWLMLQQEEPDDYVVATGRTQTVHEFCEVAFATAGMDYRDYVEVDARYYRPAEVDFLLGDPLKSNRILGWRSKTDTEMLARMMVEADLELARQEHVIANSR